MTNRTDSIKSPLLSHVAPLFNTQPLRKMPAGGTILFQGEVPRAAIILRSGIVRVFSISPQGDDQIVTFHIAGEFFPSSWIFGKAAGTMFFYEAVTECEFVTIGREELITYMMATPAKTHALLDYFTTNFAASMIRVNALEQPKARDKIIYTLYFLCRRYAEDQYPKAYLPLTLTHQNLASLMGLTRETTAATIGELKRQNILSYHGQKYIINVEKLLESIGEDSFRDIHITA